MTAKDSTGWFPWLYGVLFLLLAGLSFVMLGTDKNLQTDFGTVSSGYFVHWYAVLAFGVLDLIGAGLLFALRNRLVVKLGVVGSGLLTLAWVGVIATYAQVGFSSASQFAQYLFGATYYGGDIRYLYDVVLGVYLITFLAGVIDLLATRTAVSAARSAPPQPGGG